LEELPELRGVLLREMIEEPGIGEGIPGKIGKDLFTHVNPCDIGANGFESASIMGFGAGTEAVIGLRRDPWGIL
jgi:hypothetical protein